MSTTKVQRRWIFMNRNLRCHPQWAGKVMMKKDDAEMRAKLMRRNAQNHPKWSGRIIKNGLSSPRTSAHQHIRCSIEGQGSGTQACKNVSAFTVQLPMKDGETASSGSLQINIHITRTCPCVGHLTIDLNL
ncbi:hypothetical protein R1flu_001229 [Riccia fluitans]|uniref:Uncharacterized protein n=1 Tax=Riccia fluitans TaxID=41844 RepID=A0ABD1Y3P3_9MARC